MTLAMSLTHRPAITTTTTTTTALTAHHSRAITTTALTAHHRPAITTTTALTGHHHTAITTTTALTGHDRPAITTTTMAISSPQPHSFHTTSTFFKYPFRLPQAKTAASHSGAQIPDDPIPDEKPQKWSRHMGPGVIRLGSCENIMRIIVNNTHITPLLVTFYDSDSTLPPVEFLHHEIGSEIKWIIYKVGDNPETEEEYGLKGPEFKRLPTTILYRDGNMIGKPIVGNDVHMLIKSIKDLLG